MRVHICMCACVCDFNQEGILGEHRGTYFPDFLPPSLIPHTYNIGIHGGNVRTEESLRHVFLNGTSSVSLANMPTCCTAVVMQVCSSPQNYIYERPCGKRSAQPFLHCQMGFKCLNSYNLLQQTATIQQ